MRVLEGLIGNLVSPCLHCDCPKASLHTKTMLRSLNVCQQTEFTASLNYSFSATGVVFVVEVARISPICRYQTISRHAYTIDWVVVCEQMSPSYDGD